MAARVVDTAQLRPGKCVLSGETQGPFIDTGKRVPRYGHVYISLKWLEEPLRELNWISPEGLKTIEKELGALRAENEELRGQDNAFDELVEAITPYLPEPEPEVVEVPKEVVRDPSDEEIEDWIGRKGADHPAVRGARRVEKGSSEEWFQLYGEKGPQRPVPEPEESEDTEDEPKTEEGPARVVELLDQEVDLDNVLSQNVKDVVAYCEEKPEEFVAALIRREWYLAEANERHIRKGVLEPLGYWDEDEDEPLYPEDDEEEETEEEDEETEEETEDSELEMESDEEEPDEDEDK